jgi:protein TonB
VTARRTPAPGLRSAILASGVLHLAVITLMIVMRPSAPPALPPIYAVELVAAPPGERAVGEVAPSEAAPEAAPTPPAPAPPAPVTPPSARTVPIKPAKPVPIAKAAKTKPTPKPVTPKAVTPSAAPAKSAPTAASAPKAGGGPTGGSGADVAAVKTEGIAFPFPGYLQNIVRQIALRFHPRDPNAPLRAEVAFLIHRDGTVSNLRFVTRSGIYAFDLEAQGAVEAAAGARAFGALPAGFADDVLPVSFAFDPRVLR